MKHLMALVIALFAVSAHAQSQVIGLPSGSGNGNGGGSGPSGSETLSFSATPTFSTSFVQSVMTLTANVTSFTLASGSDGQEKTLVFCQDATGGRTVAAPANVHGFMTVGTTKSTCSSQDFRYSSAQSAWLARSSGVINQ